MPYKNKICGIYKIVNSIRCLEFNFSSVENFKNYILQ